MPLLQIASATDIVRTECKVYYQASLHELASWKPHLIDANSDLRRTFLVGPVINNMSMLTCWSLLCGECSWPKLVHTLIDSAFKSLAAMLAALL